MASFGESGVHTDSPDIPHITLTSPTDLALVVKWGCFFVSGQHDMFFANGIGVGKVKRGGNLTMNVQRLVWFLTKNETVKPNS